MSAGLNADTAPEILSTYLASRQAYLAAKTSHENTCKALSWRSYRGFPEEPSDRDLKDFLIDLAASMAEDVGLAGGEIECDWNEVRRILVEDFSVDFSDLDRACHHMFQPELFSQGLLEGVFSIDALIESIRRAVNSDGAAGLALRRNATDLVRTFFRSLLKEPKRAKGLVVFESQHYFEKDWNDKRRFSCSYSDHQRMQGELSALQAALEWAGLTDLADDVEPSMAGRIHYFKSRETFSLGDTGVMVFFSSKIEYRLVEEAAMVVARYCKEFAGDVLAERQAWIRR
jgi:hypothetical protein